MFCGPSVRRFVQKKYTLLATSQCHRPYGGGVLGRRQLPERGSVPVHGDGPGSNCSS